jgi:hypothetical protein
LIIDIVEDSTRPIQQTMMDTISPDYTLPPIDGRPCWKVRTFDGQTLYFPMKTKERIEEEKRKLHNIGQTCLLSTPIHKILENIEQERIRNMDMDFELTLASNTNQKLWLNKYAPKHFTDLISSTVSGCNVLANVY